MSEKLPPPSAGAVRAAGRIWAENNELLRHGQPFVEYCPNDWAKIIDQETGADLAELQARLIERTKASTATAYRDAEVIRRLRVALRVFLVRWG